MRTTRTDRWRLLWLAVAACLSAGCAPHFPIVQYSVRSLDDLDQRTELVVQMPLPIPVGAMETPGWLVHSKSFSQGDNYSFLRLTPAFYYHDLQFVNTDDEYKATTTGKGRLYYDVGAKIHASIWLTIDRELSIDYLNPSGQKVTARDDEQFLPGFQIAGTVSGFTGFVQGELFSYDSPANFRLVTGVAAGPDDSDSLPYFETFTLILLYDLQSWDIETGRVGQYLSMQGASHGLFLKLNYQASGFVTIGAAIGYEWLDNNGSPGILDPGDVDQNGFVVMVQIGTGLLIW